MNFKLTARTPADIAEGKPALLMTPPGGYPLSTILKWQEVNLPSLPVGTIIEITKL